jgi:hypothetical protein
MVFQSLGGSRAAGIRIVQFSLRAQAERQLVSLSKTAPQGLKPSSVLGSCGTTEVVPFHEGQTGPYPQKGTNAEYEEGR